MMSDEISDYVPKVSPQLAVIYLGLDGDFPSVDLSEKQVLDRILG